MATLSWEYNAKRGTSPTDWKTASITNLEKYSGKHSAPVLRKNLRVKVTRIHCHLKKIEKKETVLGNNTIFG